MPRKPKPAAKKPKYPDLYATGNIIDEIAYDNSVLLYPSIEIARKNFDDENEPCAVIVYRAVAIIPAGAEPTYPQEPL